MIKNILLIIIIFYNTAAKAQNIINKTKYSNYTSAHIVPPLRIGLSTAFQYNLNNKYFVEIYGSIANDFLSKQEKYLKRNYNLRASAKTGVGIAINLKKIKLTYKVKLIVLKNSVY